MTPGQDRWYRTAQEFYEIVRASWTEQEIRDLETVSALFD